MGIYTNSVTWISAKVQTDRRLYNADPHRGTSRHYKVAPRA